MTISHSHHWNTAQESGKQLSITRSNCWPRDMGCYGNSIFTSNLVDKYFLTWLLIGRVLCKCYLAYKNRKGEFIATPKNDPTRSTHSFRKEKHNFLEMGAHPVKLWRVFDIQNFISSRKAYVRFLYVQNFNSCVLLACFLFWHCIKPTWFYNFLKYFSATSFYSFRFKCITMF